MNVKRMVLKTENIVHEMLVFFVHSTHMDSIENTRATFAITCFSLRQTFFIEINLKYDGSYVIMT